MGNKERVLRAYPAAHVTIASDDQYEIWAPVHGETMDVIGAGPSEPEAWAGAALELNYRPQVSSKEIKIDLRSRTASHSLWARLLWNALFTWYRDAGGDIDVDYDSLLCDVEIFRHMFEKNITQFWWKADLNTGYTECYDYRLEKGVKITWNKEEITLVVPVF